MKPTILIFSSSESIALADSLQANLEHQAEVTVWHQGIFDLSRYPLESLVDAIDGVEAAIFVFSPDDVVQMRGETHQVARDNVVFELGLAIGKLTRDRCFIVLPRNRGNFRLPTDVVGLTPGEFDDARRDGNLRAALGPVSNLISQQVLRSWTVVYPLNGRHGANILALENTHFHSGVDYSFAAKVPPGGELRVVIERIDGNDQDVWMYSVGTGGDWVAEVFDRENGSQVFRLLGSEEGDFRFGFDGSGRARISYLEHGSGEPVRTKEIGWAPA